jgi:undecaprenyl-diphosphatase
LTLWQLLILALVQGLTEFLPISSSAHLILASDVLGWPDQGLAFDTAVHLGTLAAVLLYFRQDLWLMVSAHRPLNPAQQEVDLGERDRQRLLARFMVLASIPALTVGYLGSAWIGEHLRNPQVIALSTLLFAVLLWQADHFGRKQRQWDDIKLRDALWIGLLQVLALIPGTSRAGITMTAGLWLGLNREAAARFSFLISIPVLGGAGAYSVLQLLRSDGQGFDATLFIGAGLVSAFVALATVHAFVQFVGRVGMLPFVIYRLLLGVLLLFLFF